MALFTPSASPAIVVKEIDLTGVVPNVQSSTGAIAGNFSWGPVEQPTLVSNEADLASKFGAPSTTNTTDFHNAAYFLRYSSDLYIIRGATADANNASVLDSDSTLIKSRADFENQQSALAAAGHTFIAKWPGEIGSSIAVELCPYSLNDSAFDNWAYNTNFDAAPGTSQFAQAKGNNTARDEVHVVVLDAEGAFTGQRGAVLETYPFMSLGTNAKKSDGSTNYILDVINTASSYIWAAGVPDDLVQPAAIAETGSFYNTEKDDISSQSMTGGTNSQILTEDEYATAFATVDDVDTITIDFLIAPGLPTAQEQITVVNNLITIAQSKRKDCVVVSSPNINAVVNNNNRVTDTVALANSLTSSSYLILDNNYLKVYDKYNDQYINIPAASSTAGIMAASDYNNAPWFSPAGSRRGAYLGVTSVIYSPTKQERDTLYKAGINPVGNIPGQGLLLFGDKTHLLRPSAFDRINVRRLFLTIERAIALAARNVMFEFNDEFTRAEFVNIVEPFLREIKGRRGITDFKVVCDETNNTAAVIDRNEFIANIFIKPARSINYITLNFVAVRTGVEFEEVVGTV